MKCSAQRKCNHCSEFYLPDRRLTNHFNNDAPRPRYTTFDNISSEGL